MDSKSMRAMIPGALILTGMASVGLGAGYLARRASREQPAVTPDAPRGRTTRSALSGESLPHDAPAAQRCGDVGPVVPGRNTQGGTVAVSPMQDMVAVVDADRDVLELLAVAPEGLQRVRSVRTGSMPTQAVFSSDGRVFVTERGQHRVSVYRAVSGERLCSTDVADEPIGIALAPDERSILVTSGVSAKLTAIDTANFTERFRVDAGRAPRGVVVTPDGRRAFVSHVAGEPLTAFDLDEHGARAHAIPAIPIAGDGLPSTPIAAVAGMGMRGESTLAIANTGVAIPLPSQAHAVVFDPQRQQVLVPFMVNRTGREVPAVARQDSYGAGSVDPQANEKVSFALAQFDIATDRWTRVDVRPSRTQLTRETAGLGVLSFGEGMHRGPSPRRVVSDAVRIPSAATLSADGSQIEIASTGTDRVVSFTIPGAAPTNDALGMSDVATERSARRGLPAQQVATAAPVETLDAPTGLVALRDGRHVVFSLVEHAIEVRNPGAAAATRIVLGEDPLPADVARGRRLFLAADDARLSSGGMSCGGCHPDGADDGLVWFLQRGPRQTPTLPGRLTPPFNWNGSAWTMEENVAQTVRRLGGTGLPMSDVDALSAYVIRGTREPMRVSHALNEAEQRGHELFAGSAACATCHDPMRNFTDGQPHELGGLGPDEGEPRFDTPSLRMVGSTAPYFHDGRYATIEALLRDPTHRMGRVEQLTPGDVDALSAYLRTL